MEYTQLSRAQLFELKEKLVADYKEYKAKTFYCSKDCAGGVVFVAGVGINCIIHNHSKAPEHFIKNYG
jgi:hypothetical protein